MKEETVVFYESRPDYFNKLHDTFWVPGEKFIREHRLFYNRMYVRYPLIFCGALFYSEYINLNESAMMVKRYVSNPLDRYVTALMEQRFSEKHFQMTEDLSKYFKSLNNKFVFLSKNNVNFKFAKEHPKSKLYNKLMNIENKPVDEMEYGKFNDWTEFKKKFQILV